MKIVIPGGSGQVGTLLARAFHADGHDVVVLSRRLSARPWRVVEWDGVSLGAWQSEIDGCDVVINLAGRSVNCRYTAKNRDQILQSRVLSTRVIGQAIANAFVENFNDPRLLTSAFTDMGTSRDTIRSHAGGSWLWPGTRGRASIIRNQLRVRFKSPARRMR